MASTIDLNPPADQSGPNIKSADWKAMESYWRMVQTLLDGIEVLREAAERYLPRFQNEKETVDSDGVRYDPYTQRLNVTPLTNIYDDISRNLSSKPFSKELAMVENTPEVYKKLAENIDGQGRNLHVFASNWFKNGIDFAVSWVMVDYTPAAPRIDGQPLSRVDEQQQGLRPYWVLVPWDQLLALYSDFIDGQEVIVHARIYEPQIVLDGFVERTVQRVRVADRAAIAWDIAGKPAAYGPATWTLWELVINKTTDTGTWTTVDAGVYSIGVIPLVMFATGERVKASYIFRPPLRTIAHMQISEYQMESNLRNLIDNTCFAMITGDGVPKPENAPPLAVGPRAVLYGGLGPDGTAGSWKYIEPSGQSVQQVSQRLDKLQNDMRDLGMQPLTQANLTVITTGQVAVKANSTVQAWTYLFKDALETAWKYTAMWLGSKDEPEVNIHTDFAAVITGGEQMTALLQMRINKDLSHESIIGAAQRFDYLPSDFDMEKNDEELAAESEPLQGEQMINPVTGQPIQPGQPGQPRQLRQPGQPGQPTNGGPPGPPASNLT